MLQRNPLLRHNSESKSTTDQRTAPFMYNLTLYGKSNERHFNGVLIVTSIQMDLVVRLFECFTSVEVCRFVLICGGGALSP